VVQRVAADTVNASCENTGNAHSHPTAFQINNNNGDKLASNETGGYILPNIKRNFSIKREGAAIPAGAAKLAVTLDDGTTVSYDVIIH
jgi:fimbrial chaperone protein